MLQDFLVRYVAECQLIEVVGVHKFVEDVRTEHDGFGDADSYAFLFVEVCMTSQQMVDESEPASFAAQTALTNAGKVAVLVETFSLEDSHNALILHPSVSDDSVKNDGAMCINVLQTLPSDALQELRDGEEGSAGKPTAYVVVGDVVEEASRGQSHDVVLQVLQVVKSCHFLHCVRVSEDEIAETEVVAKMVTKVHIYLLRVFVDETCVTFFGEFRILCFA